MPRLSQQQQQQQPLLFVYRHSAVRSEADDLRDAILLFYPTDTPVERQCLLAGQLMGLTGFIRSGLLTQPLVFELDSGLRVACAHSSDSDLTLCLGAYAAGGDTALREAVCQLHRALQFYCGPLQLAFWSASRHSPPLQERLAPLTECLLNLYCPGDSPHGMLRLVSGRIQQVPLNPIKRKLKPRPRCSRLLLAADCLADRVVACCSANPRLGRMLGCALFLSDLPSDGSQANNISILSCSDGLPPWLCATLSVVHADSIINPIDLPPLQGNKSLDSLVAFHAFLPATDWPELKGAGEDQTAGCIGRCGMQFVPSLHRMCEEIVIGRILRRLASTTSRQHQASSAPGSGITVRCQCIVWTPSIILGNNQNRHHLRVIGLFAGSSACAGCLSATVTPLLTPDQLDSLTSAFNSAQAVLAATETETRSNGSTAETDNQLEPGDSSVTSSLIHCPQALAAPSALEVSRRFPDESSLVVASLATTDLVAAAALEAVTSFSADPDVSFSSLSIRVDGRLRVSATRSDGLLTVSTSVDVAAASNAASSGSGGGEFSAAFQRRRRGVSPWTSVSGGVGSVGSQSGVNGSGATAGGFLAVPNQATPRRTRSFIGWRSKSRGV